MCRLRAFFSCAHLIGNAQVGVSVRGSDASFASHSACTGARSCWIASLTGEAILVGDLDDLNLTSYAIFR